ncbi:hypothetical protein H8959_019939 [Pygathrix nigripes]
MSLLCNEYWVNVGGAKEGMNDQANLTLRGPEVQLASAHNAPLAKVSTDLTNNPGPMEHTMETVLFTFHRFAGDKGYLMKEGLKVLMGKEFPGFLENQKDPLAADITMKDVDQRQDSTLNFQNLFSLTAGLTTVDNNYFVVPMKQKGTKQAELSNYSAL